jgi:hypothetical protein
MTDAITDEHVASVLRAFVRGCDSMLPRMAAARWLGPPRHPDMSAEVCSAWWVRRVGRLTSLAASVPGLAGALGDRLPLQDILGAAGQGLLLCAIAGEHGVHDQSERVRLLASVLFDRELDPSAGTTTPVPAQAPSGRLGVKPAAKWLWRQGRLLLAVRDELEKRPHGRVYHRVLGMLPVVGMAGDYLGERSALKRAARAADHWLHTREKAPITP